MEQAAFTRFVIVQKGRGMQTTLNIDYMDSFHQNSCRVPLCPCLEAKSHCWGPCEMREDEKHKEIQVPSNLTGPNPNEASEKGLQKNLNPQ